MVNPSQLWLHVNDLYFTFVICNRGGGSRSESHICQDPCFLQAPYI